MTEKKLLIIIGSIFGSIFLTGFIITCIHLGMWHAREIIEYQYDIISLKNTNQVEGTFTIGMGYIDTTEYYYMYRETEKGIIREKLETRISYIIETNEINPSVYKCKDKNSADIYYKIYCPENTIITSFTLN